MLRYFLDFRMEVVTRRLTHDLEQLKRRIHILEGFETIFDALDETIRIIRRSEGRQDAAEKLMKRFALDQEQVDEILELCGYTAWLGSRFCLFKRNSRRSGPRPSGSPSCSRVSPTVGDSSGPSSPSSPVTFATPRLTAVVGEVDEPEFDAEAFIVEEDAMAVLTAQGWVKRQQRIKDVGATRVRDGDSVFEVVAGSTRSSVAFFSNAGVCYVARLVDIPATTGYGVPVQTLFQDGRWRTNRGDDGLRSSVL